MKENGDRAVGKKISVRGTGFAYICTDYADNLFLIPIIGESS